MGNRSSIRLVANESNIAGLLLVVAGRDPCFGSQIITALESLDMAGVVGLPLHALRDSVIFTRILLSLVYLGNFCFHLDTFCALGD